MIVVAIIGILAAIAIPNFLRFQAKAKQSEAKANLKAFYASAKAHFSEQNTYECGACDYRPESQPLYSINFVNGGAFVLGRADCPGFAGIEAQSVNAFTATADGNIDTDPTCDWWRIDESNNLTNTTNDIDG